MKYAVEIYGNTLLLTHEQLEAITQIVDGVPRINTRYYSGNQVSEIRTYSVHDSLTVRPMPEAQYEAMVLATKLADEQKGENRC